MGFNPETEKILKAAVAGMPRVAKIIADIPTESREPALKAAERIYQQTVRDLGYAEVAAQRWALVAMSRLRSQVAELQHAGFIAPTRAHHQETKKSAILPLHGPSLALLTFDRNFWSRSKEISAPASVCARNREIKRNP
jgi:hypothetical protein